MRPAYALWTHPIPNRTSASRTYIDELPGR